jgi:hypothetical protein
MKPNHSDNTEGKYEMSLQGISSLVSSDEAVHFILYCDASQQVKMKVAYLWGNAGSHRGHKCLAVHVLRYLESEDSDFEFPEFGQDCWLIENHDCDETISNLDKYSYLVEMMDWPALALNDFEDPNDLGTSF